MNSLYLHMPAPEGECRAWLAGTDGLVELGQGSLEHFAQLHPGSPTFLFLPSSLCLFANVAISAKQLRQAEQSLGWLVEDQTGEDVENLHVVAGPQEGDQTPLLALSRPVLQEFLERLRGNGLRPRALLPDLLLLPRDDSDWQLAQQGERVFLRTGFMSGAVMEPDALDLMLDGALLERESEEPLSISVAIPDVELAARVEEWAAAHAFVDCRVAENLGAASALTAVADWARHPANLLQGSFMPRSRLKLPRVWRLAAGLVGAAFALQLVNEWVHYGYYDYKAGKVAEQAVARYRSLFAGETLPAATRSAFLEVQKRMRGRRNENRSDASALPTLTRIAQSLQGSGLSTQRLDLSGSGVLTLDVDARSLSELDGLKQKLDEQGLVTEIVSANSQGGFIRGRLRVEIGA